MGCGAGQARLSPTRLPESCRMVESCDCGRFCRFSTLSERLLTLCGVVRSVQVDPVELVTQGSAVTLFRFSSAREKQPNGSIGLHPSCARPDHTSRSESRDVVLAVWDLLKTRIGQEIASIDARLSDDHAAAAGIAKTNEETIARPHKNRLIWTTTQLQVCRSLQNDRMKTMENFQGNLPEYRIRGTPTYPKIQAPHYILHMLCSIFRSRLYMPFR